jgi:hypothetical protein
MNREGTKEAAEAVLRELPSVIGALVREDVHGNPREIHLLVRAGPNPRHLAYDVRDLLEERLGIPVDQRVISIAQLAPGREPGPLVAAPEPAAAPTAPPPSESVPASEPAADVRLRFGGIAVESLGNRVRIHVSLEHGDVEHLGEATGLDTLQARIRTAASATLKAVDAVCVGRARFEVEHVSHLHAFERDYVLVTILASSPFLGRKPLQLVAAQAVEIDAESAASLAALKAINRTLALVLRLSESGRRPPAARRRPGRG